MVVPISTRKPKSQVDKSVATPPKKTVASESTIQKSKSYYKMLYEKTSKAWKWWIEQQCPSEYKWVPKTKMKWVPKTKNENVKKRVSFAIDNVSRITNVLKLTNSLGSNLSNVPSSSNSLADCSTHPIHVDSGCTKHMIGNLKLLCNFVEKYLGTVHFGNDQFALILALPTQAWLWHRRLSHLNFDYINLLSKKDVVIGLPKVEIMSRINYVPACNWSKAKRSTSDKDILGLYFLRSKDETLEVLKEFLTMIQRNLQALVISVRTDRGTKFLNKTFRAFFKEEGIKHQTFTPRTPEQNGVVKR
ncbi:retrovirus-related pol polyprotein from transposon TNT 1-94 [Tanacetum coccineum]